MFKNNSGYDSHSCCSAKAVPFSLASGLPGETYPCDVGMDDLIIY